MVLPVAMKGHLLIVVIMSTIECTHIAGGAGLIIEGGKLGEVLDRAKQGCGCTHFHDVDIIFCYEADPEEVVCWFMANKGNPLEILKRFAARGDATKDTYNERLKMLVDMANSSHSTTKH